MSDSLKESVIELLDDLSEIYEIDIRYQPELMGLYTHLKMNNEGSRVKDIEREELEGLGPTEISSLVRFGFNPKGVNTDNMYTYSEVFFVTIDEEEDCYKRALKEINTLIRTKMNTNHINYIILQDDNEDLLINYNLDFAKALTQQSLYFDDTEKLRILYFNLEGNYLRESHRTRCLTRNNLSLDKDIENIIELAMAEEGTVKYSNKDVILSKESYEGLTDLRLLYLAYF